MSRVRLVFLVALICLPATLIISVGAFFVVRDVPRAIRAEPARLGRAYRDVAETIAEKPATHTRLTERRKGWRQAGRIDGQPWGYTVRDAQTTVWWKGTDGAWYVLEVATLKPFPYVLVCYVGGSLVALLIVLVTALAVICFVRFLRARDDFLAATAHDLTTPLVSMRYLIGRDDDAVRKLNERLLVIVGNIRDFLRLGGTRQPMEMKTFDLAALTREAYVLFADDFADATSGPATISSGELLVCGDETRTLQILWNLWGNDLKYAAPHGVVEIRFRTEGAFGCVDFVDQGPGLSAHERRKAFDRYYRAKTVLQSGKGGFGIGLCTAREFARGMGGDLSVRANVPTGCVFTLALPVNKEKE